MTEAERAESRSVQPGIGREVLQSFYLMGLLACTMTALLGLALLAGSWLG